MSGNEFGSGKKNILTKEFPVLSRFEKNRGGGGEIFTPLPLVRGGLNIIFACFYEKYRKSLMF